MKLPPVFFLLLGAAFGQTAGTVAFTSPGGPLSVTAGSLTCTIAKMAGSTPLIGRVCTVGGTRYAPAPEPLKPTQSEFIDYLLNGDQIGIIVSVDATGAMTWQAAATPAGIVPGQTGSASGSGAFAVSAPSLLRRIGSRIRKLTAHL